MTNPGFADWLAIVSLKARYCRCLDTKDWDGYADVFTDDLILDTTASGGSRILGRAAAIAFVRRSVEQAVTTHHVHNPEITIEGDHATAIWAMQDHIRWPNGRRLFGSGHYHEQCRRIGGVWRIAESRLSRVSLEVNQD